MISNRKTIYLIAMVLMVAIIAVFIVVAIQSSGREIYTDFVAIGQESYDRGDYDSAIIAFKKALSANPKNEIAYIGLIKAFHALGKDYVIGSLIEQAERNGLSIVELKQKIGLSEDVYAYEELNAYEIGTRSMDEIPSQKDNALEEKRETPLNLNSTEGNGEDSVSKVNELCTVSGSVKDATTNARIGGVRIVVHKDGQDGQVVQQINASWGEYSFQLPKGKYTLEAICDEYDSAGRPLFENAYVAIELKEGQMYHMQNIDVSPTINAGEIRIVLTWGSTIRDMDAYLRGTSSTGSNVFINYMFRDATSSKGKTAVLDTDCRSGYGPETITIYDLGGDYTFSVVDYMIDSQNDESQFRNSGAVVTIYAADGKSRSIRVSDAGGSSLTGDFHWVVCRIKNEEVTTLNMIEDTTFTPGTK